MREKPMLMTKENYFKSEDGRKTQTRRIMQNQPSGGWEKDPWVDSDGYYHSGRGSHLGTLSDLKAPYKVGDHIWIKEPFRVTALGRDINSIRVEYKYTNKSSEYGKQAFRYLTIPELNKFNKWKKPYRGKSSLFMFKSLARLWLEVTEVRVERLQDISYDDVIAEGAWCYDWAIDFAKGMKYPTWKQAWIDLWDSINKNRADWNSNPWVWVYTFKKIERTG